MQAPGDRFWEVGVCLDSQQPGRTAQCAPRAARLVDLAFRVWSGSSSPWKCEGTCPFNCSLLPLSPPAVPPSSPPHTHPAAPKHKLIPGQGTIRHTRWERNVALTWPFPQPLSGRQPFGCQVPMATQMSIPSAQARCPAGSDSSGEGLNLVLNRTVSVGEWKAVFHTFSYILLWKSNEKYCRESHQIPHQVVSEEGQLCDQPSPVCLL